MALTDCGIILQILSDGKSCVVNSGMVKIGTLHISKGKCISVIRRIDE